MTESREHAALVSVICQYVRKKHPLLDPSLFSLDDGMTKSPPPLVGDGHRPDFMYEWGSVLVIGEAKTPFDLERQHSISQYSSYLRHCEGFEGEAHLILSTNWDCEAAARNLLKKMSRDAGISKTHIKVISQMTLLGLRDATD